MSEKIEIEIKLKIKGQEIELTLIEAQQLASALKSLLPEKEVISYPVYPNYPSLPLGTWVTYTDTTGKKEIWQQQLSGEISVY